MTPGPRLDALLHRTLEQPGEVIPAYSTDTTAALVALDAAFPATYQIQLSRQTGSNGAPYWTASARFLSETEASAATLPFAIAILIAGTLCDPAAVHHVEAQDYQDRLTPAGELGLTEWEPGEAYQSEYEPEAEPTPPLDY